jgi:parvulin-like peptidyl-prolyl isomerase
MTNMKSPAVSLGDVSLSVTDWFVSLRKRGRLQPLLREAVIEQFLVSQARQSGLTVSAEELQQAADAVRRRQGLTSAEQCRAWLAGHGRSVLDFEDALEADLLIVKLTDHLTRERIAAHFAANEAGYAQARLRLILVPREDEAREVLTQLHEEGRDFAELAREHSRHSSRSQGGLLGLVRRGQLTSPDAEAAFQAGPGEIVGPLAGREGFSLFLAEARTPAVLDGPTTALIRQQLFAAWLADTLRRVPVDWPLLDLLSGSQKSEG